MSHAVYVTAVEAPWFILSDRQGETEEEEEKEERIGAGDVKR